MSKSNIGDRVGAILSASEEEIQFLGYGVYEGDFIPEEAVGDLASIAVEAGITNPRIKLDNGSVVYGCECWWGPENAIKARIEKAREAGTKIINVTIGDFRQEYLNSQN